MIFFDTETTGLDFNNDNIIEIALLVVDNGEIIGKYNEFIKQATPLSNEIKNLTGISNEDLDEGVEEEEVAKSLYEFLSNGTLMIAHNCQFDLNFIYNLLCKYYNEEEIHKLFSSMSWLDTLTIFKDRKRFPHKLRDMVAYYNIGDVNFHRAIDDTVALSKCVKALHDERNDVLEYINVFGFNPKYGINGKEFEFIRYIPQSYNKCMVGKDYILPLL